MRIYIRILTLSFFLLNTLLIAQWTPVFTSTTLLPGTPLNLSCFDNEHIALSTKFFLLSNDCGLTTSQIQIPSGSGIASYIQRFSETKIWFAGGDGGIYFSSDAGASWQMQFRDPSITQFINIVHMFDATNGVALGDAPAVDKPFAFLKTTNGGQSWNKINTTQLIGAISANIAQPICFSTTSTYYFYDSQSRKLYKSIDGGVTWNSILTVANSITKVRFYNADIGLIMQRENASTMSLHRTTDGGATWQKLWSDAGGAGSQHGIATEITFVPNDPQKVWIAGRTKLYFSSDMGATLTEDPLTANGTVLNWPLVQLTNNNTGYLLTTGALMRTLTANAVVTSARDEHTSNPDMYSLAQNYPNPFNPATTISYQIAQNEMVSLTVTDAIGRVVKTLVNEVKEPGSYSVEFNAVDLSSGVYFYTLRAGDFSATKKLILLR